MDTDVDAYTVREALADSSMRGRVTVEGMLVVTPHLTFLVEKVGDLCGMLVEGHAVRRALHTAPRDPRLPPGRRGPTQVQGMNVVEFIGIARVVGRAGHSGI